MLKKETFDVLKQIVIFAIFILAVPLFLVITKIIPNQPYLNVLFPIFQFALFFWAFFMGAALFSIERNQRGMEYLLSLPYSRYKLFGIKILPRLAAVLLFFLVFSLLYQSGCEDLAAFPSPLFTFIYFSFFLISLSLSSTSENFLVLFVSSMFFFFIYFRSILLIFWLANLLRGVPYYMMVLHPFSTLKWDPEINLFALFSALVLLIPFLISFALSINKFDIRPAKVYNKRYFKFFTPLFVIFLLFSFLFAYQGLDVEYSWYYLTRDHKLIETNFYEGIKIYDDKKVHKIKGELHYIWPFYEENRYVYDRTSSRIIRMDTSDYTLAVLYEAPPKRRISGSAWKHEHMIAFVERQRDLSDRQLVFLDENTKTFKKIPLDNRLIQDFYNPNIFGANIIEGQRCWLLSVWQAQEEKQIFSVREDGRIEHISKSQKWPFYINRMLITYTEDEVIISRQKNSEFEIVKKIPNPDGYRFGYVYFFRNDLNTTQVKKVYGWSRSSREKDNTEWKYATLNLESFEIKPIQIKGIRGYLFYSGPNDIHIEEIDFATSTIKVYRLEDEKTTLLKTYKNFDPREPANRHFIFPSGIVLRRGKKVKVYAFPDLRELKYKKL